MNRKTILVALLAATATVPALWTLAQTAETTESTVSSPSEPEHFGPTAADKWARVTTSSGRPAHTLAAVPAAPVAPRQPHPPAPPHHAPPAPVAPVAKVHHAAPSVAMLAALHEADLTELAEAPEPPEPPEPPEAPEPPEPPAVFAFSGGEGADHAFNAFALANEGRSPAQPLVIASKSSPENLPELREDLAVMARLLTKAAGSVSGNVHHQAMGITLSMLGESGGGSRSQPLYLEGFGAVFTLRVGFPLLEPPKQDAEKSDKEENPTREAWEEARREIHGGKSSQYELFTGTDLNWTTRSKGVAYNAETVERLKKEILDTLKHASNIRNLQPDDHVVVAVIGAAGSSQTRTVKVTQPRAIRGSTATAVAVNRVGTTNPSDARGSTLTVRVLKSDADAFAKGKMTLEEFTRKAAIASY